jgi:transposase
VLGNIADDSVFQKTADRRTRQLPCVHVTATERAQLVEWVRRRTSPHRLVVRSRIVLLAHEGLSAGAIASRLHVMPATVRLWCKRFHRGGVASLVRDAPGRGRRPGMSVNAVIAVLRAMAENADSGRPWTARTLAARARTSASTVSRIWKRYRLSSASSADDVRRALEQVISDTPELEK